MSRECILRVEMTSESVTVDGELDSNTAPLLAAAHDAPIVDVFDRLVRVDARGVTFCDVAGLRAVRCLTDSLQQSGHRVWLLPSASMQRLFELARLSPVSTDHGSNRQESTTTPESSAPTWDGPVVDRPPPHRAAG